MGRKGLKKADHAGLGAFLEGRQRVEFRGFEV
jgi:hypothetical protein